MMNSKRLLTICGFAIGAAAISAAPAGAVLITGGNLAFNDGAQLGSGAITTAGGNFSVNFSSGGNAIVTDASGGFSPLVPGVVNPTTSVARTIAPSVGNFSYTSVVPAATGGTFTATLLNALNYNFGSTIGSVNLGIGSTFTGFYIAPTPAIPSLASGHSFLNFNTGNVSFLSGTSTTGGAQTTPLLLTSFNFDVDNATGGSSNGSYSIVASAVPEPFTIIGTLVGGTAALRMRKKLIASVSK